MFKNEIFFLFHFFSVAAGKRFVQLFLFALSSGNKTACRMPKQNDFACVFGSNEAYQYINWNKGETSKARKVDILGIPATNETEAKIMFI